MIGLEYNKKQAELLDKIFRSISNGEEGYKRLSRNKQVRRQRRLREHRRPDLRRAGRGEEVLARVRGHHITVRCDGNSEEKTAFGGPLYYGHSPSGYATNNVFYHQTKIANEMFGVARTRSSARSR